MTDNSKRYTETNSDACPNCGSDDIIGNANLGYTCRDCGEEWGGTGEYGSINREKVNVG